MAYQSSLASLNTTANKRLSRNNKAKALKMAKHILNSVEQSDDCSPEMTAAMQTDSCYAD